MGRLIVKVTVIATTSKEFLTRKLFMVDILSSLYIALSRYHCFVAKTVTALFLIYYCKHLWLS